VGDRNLLGFQGALKDLRRRPKRESIGTNISLIFRTGSLRFLLVVSEGVYQLKGNDFA
jgi:hypothetical protein